jgi:adenylate cyclase
MTEPSTFVFADLAGFTALTEVHGDEEAADLVAEFVGAVRELLDEHHAEGVKTIGDAVMIRCGDAEGAVRLGVQIAEEIGRRDRFPSIRIGMHTGPATEREGDYFGATVNLAARVAGLAAGGQVLLTEATRDAAGRPEGLKVVELGKESLRNVREPVLLFRARSSEAAPSPELPIDPVCRMAVEPHTGAGVLEHGGIQYHFCSLECVRAFAADPSRYLGPGAGEPPA